MKEYKSVEGILRGLISKFSKEKEKSYSSMEIKFLLSESLRSLKETQKKERVNLQGWKGKSGIAFIHSPDKFICITHQKADQDSSPKEISHEITKDDANKLIVILNTFLGWDDSQLLEFWNYKKEDYLYPTRLIAEYFYREGWDDVFSNRPKHQHLNLILRLLDHLKITNYRGGYTRILGDEKQIPLLT